MITIHRMNSTGQPRCGATTGKVSRTGVMITCHNCLELQKPMDMEAALKRMHEIVTNGAQNN